MQPKSLNGQAQGISVAKGGSVAQNEVIKTDVGQIANGALNWIAILVVGQIPFYLLLYITIEAFNVSTVLGVALLLIEATCLKLLYDFFFLTKPPKAALTSNPSVVQRLPPRPDTSASTTIKQSEPPEERADHQARLWVKREFGDLKSRRWSIEFDNDQHIEGPH